MELIKKKKKKKESNYQIDQLLPNWEHAWDITIIRPCVEKKKGKKGEKSDGVQVIVKFISRGYTQKYNTWWMT